VQQQSAATREVDQNVEELRHASQNRVLPSPMRTTPSPLVDSSASEDEHDGLPLGNEFQSTQGDQF